tara:strand:- start:187 stop:549 length:363 start_codon:yes stop_codon:yes gene_type:complete
MIKGLFMNIVFDQTLLEVLKIITTISIFFVWYIRYENVKKEFEKFGYPSWFRDLSGILKISFIVMLHSHDYTVNLIGAIGISIMMLGAVITHIKMNDNFRQSVASCAMLAISLLILYSIA